MSNPEYLFWLDLETTGLDPENDLILEAAVVVTTADLERVVDQYHAPVHHIGSYVRKTIVNSRDAEFLIDMHTGSGLLGDIERAELGADDVRADIAQRARKYEGAYLAGSGVHFDRAFLQAQWPEVLEPLHYRNLDVSTIRTFVNLWHPRAAYKPAKKHRAMADVEDAINEARYYTTQLRVDDSWAAGVLRQKVDQ